MTGHREICQFGLRGIVYKYLCLAIFLIYNIGQCEYDKDVCCLVEFQKGVFVLQNSLHYGLQQSIFYAIAPEVEIAFYQLYWLSSHSKAWEMH